MIRHRFALFVLAIAATLPLHAEVRLLAPIASAELTGGSREIVEWIADAGDLPAHVEEWEAFLSVDGGKYYATRITPHLDASVRRFAFTVPNVTTSDARILLRFGDERRETEVELPQRFAIRGTVSAVPRGQLVSFDGEAAREGDRPVVSWAAGERDGSEIRELTRRDPAMAAHRVAGHALPHCEDPEPTDAGICVPVARVGEKHFGPRLSRSWQPSLPPQDVLLATMRLNI